MNRFFFVLVGLFLASSAFAQEDTGVASYYGDEFNGRKTSSGEIYNPQAMTAAHRTLRFGTRLLVTNLDNGRQVVVKVNDRGPFVKNRLIDLSKAAAYRLGVVGPGTANVKIRALQFGETVAESPALPQKTEKTESSVPPNDQKVVSVPGFVSGALFIQVGAFKTVEGAQTFSQVLVHEGFSPQIHVDGSISRVFLKANDDSEAKTLVQRLVASGQKTFLQLKNEPRGNDVKLATN